MVIQQHSTHIHLAEASHHSQVRREPAAAMAPVATAATTARQAVATTLTVSHRMLTAHTLHPRPTTPTMQLQPWPYSVRMCPRQAFSTA